MRNCNIDAHGDSRSIGQDEKVDGYIEGATGALVKEAVGGFPLKVVLCTNQVGKGGNLLEDGKQSISNVVVQERPGVPGHEPADGGQTLN
jgi:hypothetical protein